MEPIHTLSAITPLPEFDLWAVPPTQLTVERVIDVDYRPITTVDDKSPMVFNIQSAIDEYVKLDEIYMSWNVQFEISKDNGTNPTADDYKDFLLMGFGMHSMIKQVEFEVNTKQISNLPQNYAYRAFIEALLGFSKDARKTHLSAAFWDETYKTMLTASSTLNKSIKYHMMGRLHTDLGFQGRYMIGGCNLKITVALNNPKFYLKLKNGFKANVILKDAVIHIQKAKISKDIVEAHRRALEIAPAKYPITRSEVKHIVVPKGVNEIWIDNFVFGQLPRRMFVFMVENDSFSGSYSKDPFNFKHFNLNHICAYIDGIPYPSQPYQPDFEDGKFMREYLGLFDALNQNRTDAICTLDKNTYKDNKSIFGFNFSSDLSNGMGMEGHVNMIKRGTLRLQFKFNEALSNAINVLAYCEFDNIIEINSDGEVTSNVVNV